MHGISFVLTPAASKRLIARAVAKLPPVQKAMASGRLVIAGGITNAYVVEELQGKVIDKAKYTSGIITSTRWGLTAPETRLKFVVYENGEVSPRLWQDVLPDFTPQDVFIKGGNALDATGNVGILVGGKFGGTIGTALGHLIAVGAQLILPIGLEKLIPSVNEASRALALGHSETSVGMRCGLFGVSYGQVITEIDALQMLYGLKAVHVSSGGVGGSEGAVGLFACGEEAACQRWRDDLRVLQTEPPVRVISESACCD